MPSDPLGCSTHLRGSTRVDTELTRSALGRFSIREARIWPISHQLVLDNPLGTLMTETETSSVMPAASTQVTDRATNNHVSTTDASPAAEHYVHEILIRNRPGWIAIDWKEFLAYHELLFFLIWRDMSARYKQTVLGPLWAILQPVVMMTIFTLVFSRMQSKLPGNVPYSVFVFAGLIPWTLFSQGFNQASLSLVNQTHLLTKVYFPRVFVPTAASAVFIIDLLISMVIYGLILFYYGIWPSWTIVFVPLLIVLTFCVTLSLGLIFSALTVFYRDFRHLVPFVVQILMYISPVIIPTNQFPARFRWVFALNPMFGTIDAFRSAILGTPCDFMSLAISITTTSIFMVFGLYYFCRTEKQFADFA